MTVSLTPFNATACKIHGLKDYVLRFPDYPFTCRCKTGNRKAEGFEISHYNWSFSSDIMALKGLIISNTRREVQKEYGEGKGKDKSNRKKRRTQEKEEERENKHEEQKDI